MKKEKESKPKKHYAVYYEGHGWGCYAENYSKVYIDDTWAVSPEKACSNVRYRYRNEKMPNGGYATEVLGDYLGEGEVLFEYKAYEID